MLRKLKELVEWILLAIDLHDLFAMLIDFISKFFF